MKSSLLGIIALVIGVVALGLAALPRIVMEHPRRLESTDELPRPIDSRPTHAAETKTNVGITFEIGNFSVTVGDSEPEISPAEQHRQQVLANHNAAVDRQLARREAIARQFTFAANCCALLGLVLGPIAWVREKQPFLAGSAITVCIVTLFLEYVVIGICIAIVFVFVMMFLAAIVS